MALSNLLRWPGTSCPEEVLTRDPVLDAFLEELDSHLLGSRHVRQLTLAEIRDHLEEEKAFRVSEGLDESTAAHQAVKSVGSVEQHAWPQRRHLQKKFTRVAVLAGIVFAVLMDLLHPLKAQTAYGRLAVGVFHGVFFGLSLGLFVTFVWPERWVATGGRRLESWRTTEFEVRYPAWLRAFSHFYLGLFLLMVGFCFVEGIMIILDHGVFGWPWWVPFALGGLCVHNIFNISLACRSFLVDADGFWIRGWGGLARRVAWNDVRATGLFGEVHPWIPSWNGWHQIKFIDFISRNGRARRVLVPRDMFNADRFLQLLRSKIENASSEAEGK